MATPVNQSAGTTKRSYRRAAAISIAVHVFGALLLLCWYVPNRVDPAADSVAATSSPSDSTDSSAPKPRPPAPPPASEIPPEQIEASIDSQIAQFEKLPDERKLSELEKNLKRLDRVSNPQSVQQVTTKIASTLGLDTETYQPKESAAEGPFDPSTAQIDDVIRTKSEDGQWIYESILVDAEGRKQNVPMTEDDGETTYEAFQQMKQFPMAAGIYRSVVMPLIQKTVAAAEIAKEAAAKAEQAAIENRGDAPER